MQMVRTLLMTLLVLGLAGAGATGAYMVGSDMGWADGHHGMMGDGAEHCPVGGGAHPEDCPHEDLAECEDGGDGCAEHAEDCDHPRAGPGCW